jgi:cell division protein FtsQ
MDRSLTARLGRSLAPAGLARGQRRTRGGPARRARRGGGPDAGLGAAALAAARGAAVQVWQRRRLRVALLAGLGALALLGGGWQLLRHSPLAAVEHVRIGGVRGADGAQIDAVLQRAARHMNTLDVRRGALLAAVARFPQVRDLSVSPSFPHGLRIHVIEQLPVAVLSAGGIRTAVAADGVVLGAGLIGGSLPSVHAAGVAPLQGARVAAASTRAELAVLGAAPETLLGWVQRVFSGPEGLTVTMRDGLAIYFGNATRAHAKWLSAARVLADPSSAGASYLDVRLPERPAAGNASGSLGDSASTQVSASDPSAAALAATLDEAVAGGSSATASAATPSEPSAASAAQTPATGAGEEASAGAGTATTAPATTPSSAETSAPATTEVPAGTAESTPEPSSSTSG